MFSFSEKIKEYIIENDIDFSIEDVGLYKGYYIPQTDDIFVDLNAFTRCSLFGKIDLSDDGLIENISKTITHEYIHNLIQDCLDNSYRNNDKEEEIVQDISGQLSCCSH